MRLPTRRRLATFKTFLLDEAWLFIKNETIRNYVVQAQKTWRKHNAAMILATQSIKELEESGMLAIVAESCPTKIFLANPEMNREVYREAFHLNDTELDLIGGLVPPGPNADSEGADLKESAFERRFGLALDGNQQRPRQPQEAGVFRPLRFCGWASPSGGRLSIPAARAGGINHQHQPLRRRGMRSMKFIINSVLLVSSIGVVAQDSARTVQYHSQDIIPIRAKVKYTTLIELPTTEKIMEAATGDKDFWIVDVVGNFCFVHPAKQGISSNLNLITDKGNIYSFTLQDISGSTPATSPDLKVIVEPADRSAIVAASGPPQFVPAAQLEQSRQQLAALQSHVEQAVDEYKSAYPTQLKFDYVYKANEAPFDIQSIYHDDKFTYIKTNAPEKFSVYEMKDGKPNLVTYDLREGTYIIPKIMNSGYVELGKKKMEFTRKG